MYQSEVTTILAETDGKRDRDHREFAQFLLVPRLDDPIRNFCAQRGWHVQGVADLSFCHHPGLTVTRADGSERSMLCAGDIFDSRDPLASNATIVGRLAQTCATPSQLERALDDLGGRWVIAASFPSGAFVYHDAGALKSICVYRTDARLVLGSQPGLVAAVYGLTPNQDRVRQISAAGAPSWPIWASPYDGVYMLPPNHRVDLTRARVERYWPPEPLGERAMAGASAEIFQATSTLIAAMTARRRCYLGLTAGYDSRMLAACSRDCHDRLAMFTMTGRPSRMDKPTDLSDEAIPAAIARRLGARYKREAFDTNLSPRARQTLSNNAAGMYRDQALRKTLAYRQVAGDDGVVLQALGGELLRTFYTAGSTGKRSNVEQIVARTEFRDVPFANEGVHTWLQDVPEAGIDPLVLLYWEQRFGIWASLGLTAREAMVEIWSPFNCRRILQAALEVPAVDRRPPYRLVQGVIARGDPALLRIPFNTSFRSRLVRALPVPWRVKRYLGWA